SDVWAATRTAVAPTRSPFAALLRPPLRRVALCGFALAALNMSAYWFTYSWMPAYLATDRGLGITRSGLWLLTIVAGELAGYGSLAWFAARFGRRPAFTAFALLMATGLLMITLFWAAVEGRPALLLAFMLLVGFGTGSWSTFGPFFAELFPTALRNTAVGSIF